MSLTDTKRFPMTPKGDKALRQELDYLKDIKRPQISVAIAHARELGDLRENSEYHAAREEQSFTEKRINEIEFKLLRSEIIDVKTIPYEDKVIFGSTVVINHLEDNKHTKYTIVGEDEADIKLGKISNNTPLAHAMIGKNKGDIIDVKTPKADLEYEIIEIIY